MAKMAICTFGYFSHNHQLIVEMKTQNLNFQKQLLLFFCKGRMFSNVNFLHVSGYQIKIYQ